MRGTLLLSALLCASCVAVPVPAERQAQPGEVRFEMSGPGGAALVVPVSIGDAGPFPFILDTGATLTCVDTRLAVELELPEVKGVTAVGGTVTGLGAVALVQLPSIAVGTARAESLRACVLDLAVMEKAGLEARGLLGLNFLRAYRLTLDFGTNLASFEDTGAPSSQ